MPTYQEKIKSLPDEVQQSIYNKKSMSYSRANTWHSCPQRGKFQYIDKLPQPESDALRWGKMFDLRTENDISHVKGVNRDDENRITNKALECLESYSPSLTRVSQFPVYAEIVDGWWFHGFADDVFFNERKVLVGIEDRKFSAVPWKWKKPKNKPECEPIYQKVLVAYRGKSDKTTYYAKQAQCYLWALSCMGYNPPKEFVFRVANMQQSGIQEIVYKPQQKSILGIRDWLMEAIEISQATTYIHNGGHHCEWCPYTNECDEAVWG